MLLLAYLQYFGFAIRAKKYHELFCNKVLENYCLIVKYLILDWINSEDSTGCNKKDINHDHIQDVVNCQIRVQKAKLIQSCDVNHQFDIFLLVFVSKNRE